MPLAVRLTPHIATPAELARAKREARERPVASGDADKTVARILRARSASRATQEGWMRHPDERVPMALVEAPFSPHLWNERTMTEVAIQAAADEGMVWTPLLDLIEIRNAWFRWSGSSHSGSGPQVPDMYDQLQPLGPAVHAERDPREVERLLEFYSYAVHRIALQETTVIDDTLVEAALRNAPDSLDVLAANPALTPAQAARLATGIVEQVLTDARRVTPATRPYGVTPVVPDITFEAARSALNALGARGHVLPPEAVEMIAKAATADHLTTVARASGRPRLMRGAAQRLVFDQQVPVSAGELLAVAQSTGVETWGEQHGYAAIAAHPAATPAVWEVCATRAKRDDRGAWMSLVRHSGACAMPVVQDAVVACAIPDAIVELAAAPESSLALVARCFEATLREGAAFKFTEAVPADRLATLPAPLCRDALASYLAQKGRDSRMDILRLRTLACLPQVRALPVLRGDLEGSTDVGTAWALATAPDWPVTGRRSAFRTVAAQYPAYVLDELEGGMGVFAGVLESDDFLAMFESKDGAVRQRALLAVSRLSSPALAEAVSAPPLSQARRR